MTLQRDIGVGVVGLGLGRKMLQLRSLPDSRLAVRAACDLDDDLLAMAMEEEGVAFATRQYEKLLQRPEVAIVGIFTPDRLHADQIIAALEAGKHVVVTKPMVNTSDEAARVMEAVRVSGKKLLVGQTERFVPVNMAAKALVDSGAIGEPLFVQASYIYDMRTVLQRTGWRKDPKNKLWLAGAGCHAIDLAQWFAGDVTEVAAYANEGVELPGRVGINNFTLNLKFRSGALGRIAVLLGLVRPPAGPVSPRAPVSMRYMSPRAVCCRRGTIVGDRYSLDTPEGVVERELEIQDPATGHQAEIFRYMRHLERCVTEDLPTLVDAAQGAKTVTIAEAAMRSIESGRSEKVADVR